MGAWIEISICISFSNIINVAPYMGAWIEILFRISYRTMSKVAPYMGAWIEIHAICGFKG